MVQSPTFIDYCFPPEDLSVFAPFEQGDIMCVKNIAQCSGLVVGTVALTIAVSTIIFGGAGVFVTISCALIGTVSLIGGLGGNVGAVAIPLLASLACCVWSEGAASTL